jgi:hypothetical protein
VDGCSFEKATLLCWFWHLQFELRKTAQITGGRGAEKVETNSIHLNFEI